MPSITNIYRNFVQGVREDQNQSDRIAKLEKWVEYLEGLIASSSLWARDPLNGWLYPITLTDDVGMGTATPYTQLHVKSIDNTSTTPFTGAWISNPSVYQSGEFYENTITDPTSFDGQYIGANVSKLTLNLASPLVNFSTIASQYNHLYQPVTSNASNNRAAIYGAINESSNYANGTLAVYGSWNIAKNNTTDVVFGTSPQIIGVQTNAINDGAANIQYLWGSQTYAQNRSTGTVQNLRAIYAGAYNLTVGGIVNSLYGYELAGLINSGTIDNTYGIRINSLTSGTQTNAPYSIYSSDANAHFYHNGRISIGAARDVTIKALIQGTDATSANYALKLQNSTTANILSVRNDYYSLFNGTVDISHDPLNTNRNYTLNVSMQNTSAINVLFGQLIDVRQLSNNNVAFMKGINNFLRHQGTGTVSTFIGIDSYIQNGFNTTGVVGTGIAISAQYQQISNSGTTTNGTGLLAIVDNNTATGTIGTVKLIDLFYRNLGTNTNIYGIYVQNLTQGTQTNAPYSIYSVDANAHLYHNGRVSIGAARDITIKALIQGTDATNANYAIRAQDSAAARLLTVRNDGEVAFKNYAFPIADGTANQLLVTDGVGALSFASIGTLPGKKYVAAITGLGGTILGATHLQGADVVVQIYEAGALQTATVTVNGSGDVSWSVGVALVSGKIIIV